MGNNADGLPFLPAGFQGGYQVEGILIEGAEAFVDEEGLDLSIAAARSLGILTPETSQIQKTFLLLKGYSWSGGYQYNDKCR